MISNAPVLTVCISSYNRADSLLNCLRSLFLLDDLVFEVLVLDDGSNPPLFNFVEEKLCLKIRGNLRIIRHSKNLGYIGSRNEMARIARSQFILSLDDDSSLYNLESVAQAIEILEKDSELGAVAFAQVNQNGHRFSKIVQPAPVLYDSYIPTFFGYGALIRRDLFLHLGGYRKTLVCYGEENDYCKRLLDAGFKVVYLPNCVVIHSHSPIGRDEFKKLTFGIRSACFEAIMNEPLPLFFITIPIRLFFYFRKSRALRKHMKPTDRLGVWWVLMQIKKMMRLLWLNRKPLKWSTYFEWRKTKKRLPHYAR